MRSKMKHIDILDTTLRDGSYTIEYQFTLEETSFIAQGLEHAGVNYIEIGHGLGLGADRAGKGAQAFSDVEYMRACASSVVNAKFGFFYIPGIGETADLERLRDEGGGFVRIGVGLESADQACRATEIARKLGLEVWVNVMKTYAYPVAQVGEMAVQLVGLGAAGVYVVDSAGGMLPTEVKDCVVEIKEALAAAKIKGRIGFHGHDNLSMGSACSLAAVQGGCDIVDGSLMGIGRSVGNAATEVLAMVLDRAGYRTGVNAWYAADLAARFIRPFLEQRGRNSSLDQALGYRQIHSGFLPLLERVAKSKNINLRDLVLQLPDSASMSISETDAGNAAVAVIKQSNEAMIDKKSTNGKLLTSRHSLNAHFENLELYIAELKSRSLRMFRPSALVLAGPWKDKGKPRLCLQQIRLSPSAVIGSVEISSVDALNTVVSKVDGLVDYILLDKTPRGSIWDAAIEQIERRKWQSQVLPYADEIACLIGVCHNIVVEVGKRKQRSVSLLGGGRRFDILKFLLPYWGINISEGMQTSILVITGDIDWSEILKASGEIKLELVFDLMTSVINTEAAELLLSRGVETIRFDGRNALVGEVDELIGALEFSNNIVGRMEINGVPVVAGGAWGRAGNVVVDSIKKPREVLGVADGNGNLKQATDSLDAVSIDTVLSELQADILNYK
jgi:4-hydroxy 2-oxovalerate aldolase